MAARRKHRVPGSGTVTPRANGRSTAQVTADTGRRRSVGIFSTEREAEGAIAALASAGYVADLVVGSSSRARLDRSARDRGAPSDRRRRSPGALPRRLPRPREFGNGRRDPTAGGGENRTLQSRDRRGAADRGLVVIATRAAALRIGSGSVAIVAAA